MKNKLILDLTNIKQPLIRELVATLVLGGLVSRGFHWEDGTSDPKNCDCDAIRIGGFADNRSMRAYRKGSFAAMKSSINEATFFDGSDDAQLRKFLQGADFQRTLNDHRDPPAKTFKMGLPTDNDIARHKARPLGWDDINTDDPVFTTEVEGARLSVCKHCALATGKGELTPERERALYAVAKHIAKEKFGLTV